MALTQADVVTLMRQGDRFRRGRVAGAEEVQNRQHKTCNCVRRGLPVGEANRDAGIVAVVEAVMDTLCAEMGRHEIRSSGTDRRATVEAAVIRFVEGADGRTNA